jgi:hypothetical protein
MRDPAFTLLPVTDRADRTVAWAVNLPGGSADGPLAIEQWIATDDVARLGAGRPLLVPVPAAQARALLARPLRAGSLIPLIDSDTLPQLDATLLRRPAGSTAPLPLGISASQSSFIPPRAWSRAWCLVSDVAQGQPVAATGAIPIVPGGDTRVSRRAAWQLPQIHLVGPPVASAVHRPPEATDATVGLLRVFAMLAEGRGGTSELEDMAENDLALAKELQHAVSTAGITSRPSLGASAATVAMRVLGRDPILQRIGTVLAKRCADLAGSPDLAVQLLVRALLAQRAVGADSRGSTTPVAYAAGFCSLLDVVFAQPISLIVERAQIGGAIRTALVERTGPIGDAVELAEAMANGWWRDVAERRALDQLGGVVREVWRSARRDLITLRNA